MNESILITIKKLLGIGFDQTAFDTDIIVFINSAFMALQQIGVGSNVPFSITGNTETWSDFVSNINLFESIKTYIYLKTRIVFDPPSSSVVMDALNKTIDEVEWRLHIQNREKERGQLE